MSPLCESYVPKKRLNEVEPFYPLHVFVCDSCLLVQLNQYVSASDIFSDYAYFSSYSDSWVRHAEKYVEMVTSRFEIGPGQQVMEVASNDGYLLQHFVARNVPVLGVEPAQNVADVAIEKGIPTVVRFLGELSARDIVNEHGGADLVVANNVFAHVPDINDFTAGLKTLLKPGGVLTIEVPHLWQLIELNQFDTIYHEHFQYYSLLSAERVLSAHGLTVFDVEELRSHGGSLRLYVRLTEDSSKPEQARLTELRKREIGYGFDRLETYESFEPKVHATKRKLLQFLITAKEEGRRVVGYGAPGKGNTLLNYCGIRTDFLDFTVDRNPYKQGKFAPGTRIPILDPDEIAKARPDYVLILPWNLREEIAAQLQYIREWGGQFVVPIPEVEVF
jgi:SAM-dependent methyltransferase